MALERVWRHRWEKERWPRQADSDKEARRDSRGVSKGKGRRPIRNEAGVRHLAHLSPQVFGHSRLLTKAMTGLAGAVPDPRSGDLQSVKITIITVPR